MAMRLAQGVSMSIWPIVGGWPVQMNSYSRSILSRPFSKVRFYSRPVLSGFLFGVQFHIVFPLNGLVPNT